MNKVEKIDVKELEECLDVIHKAFIPVAEMFNINKSNCPVFETFWTYENMVKKFEDGILIYKYKEDEKIIGVFMIEILDDTINIYTIAVLPESQRKGICTTFLNEAKKIAKQLGIKNIVLQANKDYNQGLACYLKNGFVIKKEWKYKYADFSIVRMEYNL